jgi:hypothetical protein
VIQQLLKRQHRDIGQIIKVPILTLTGDADKNRRRVFAAAPVNLNLSQLWINHVSASKDPHVGDEESGTAKSASLPDLHDAFFQKDEKVIHRRPSSRSTEV